MYINKTTFRTTFIISLFMLLIMFGFNIIGYTDSSSLKIYVADNVNYQYDGGEQLIDPDLEVETDGNLCSAKVYISSNFDKNKDSLSYTNVDGLTADYDPDIGVIQIKGIGDAAKYKQFLRGIKFNTTAATGTRTIEYVLNKLDGEVMYFNGHFYEFVNSLNIPWSDARIAANNRSFYGINGYLAVITSEEENTYVASKCKANGWLGAADYGDEGNWRWVTSPIEGENVQFWQGIGAGDIHNPGAAVDNRYSNWYAGVEPNNYNEHEHYLHMHSGYWDDKFYAPMKGTWNDFPNHQVGNMGGYIVEYGDEHLNIIDIDWMDSVTIDIVEHVNYAPVLNNTAEPEITSILENTTDYEGNAISEFTDGTMTDANPMDTLGIAVIGLEGNGAWQYSYNNLWTNMESITEDNALLLDVNTKIRFIPDTDWNGIAKFKYRAWDQFYGNLYGRYDTLANHGGNTSFSEVTEEAVIRVKFPSLKPVIKYNNSHKILKFDGIDDYVDIGPMTISDSFTVEMWTKWDHINTWGRFFDFGNGAPNNNIIASSYDNNKTNVFEIYTGNSYGTNKQVITEELIPLNQWIHTAFVYDNSNDMKKAAIYWNGKLIKEGDCLINPGLERLYNYFGRSNWGPNESFNGYMKDVRIWDNAKSSKEIIDNMHKRFTGSESGLLAYYPMNEESGSTIDNLVSEGFNSTANILGNAEWQIHTGCDMPLSTHKNTPISIDLHISDLDNSIDELTITLVSDNQTLISNSKLVLTGSDEVKTLTLIPNDNQIGSANITIKVDDGNNVVTETFKFNVYDNQDGVISLSCNSYTTYENVASIDINVIKTGGINKTSTVEYEIISGTATSDEDFTPATGILKFEAGDAANKIFTINIVDDLIKEDDETVNIILKNIHGGAELNISNAELTIIDNDGAPKIIKSNEILETKEEDSPDRTGVAVSEVVSGRISYPSDSIGIAITYVDNNNGTWRYYDGLYWYDIGVASETSALLMPENYKVIFIPNDNWNGQAVIKMRGWDKRMGTALEKVDTTINGDGTAFSVDQLELITNITPVNDAPTVSDLSNTKLLYFDGHKTVDNDGDYASIEPITLPDSFTIELYSKWEAHNNWSRLFDFGNGRPNNNVWAGMEGTSKRLAFEIYDEYNNKYMISSEVLPANKWIHTAFVYDGSDGYVYIDGELKARGLLNIPQVERTKNYFAKSNWDADDYFKGYLKDIRIWDTARNINEIRGTMSKTLAGNEPNLVAYYKVDESSGSILNNMVDGSNYSNATIYGAKWVEASGINTSVSILKNNTVDLNVKVRDIDSSTDSILLTATSTDETLISNSNITCSLDGENGTITLMPNTDQVGSCTINIKVSDGEFEQTEYLTCVVYDNLNGIVQFVQESYSVNENENELNIEVERTFGNQGSVSVDYSVIGGSATAGSDYEAFSGRISFLDGESGRKTISLKLLDDSILENNETVVINLCNSQGGVSLGNSETKITIVDNEVNTSPVAKKQTITTAKNTAYNGMLNGSDADGDSLTFKKNSDPSNGIAEIKDKNTGSFTYIPNIDYVGKDSFSFAVNDGLEYSAPATVSIEVYGSNTNTPPIAEKQTITTAKNTAYNGILSGSDADGDSLIFKKNSDPSYGIAEIKDKNTGSFTYIPNIDYVGKDSFSFVVNDGLEYSAPATVSIEVYGSNTNTPPIAEKQTITTAKNTAYNGILSGSDADGDSLTFKKNSDLSHGILEIKDESTGSFTYIPDIDYVGGDSFSFVVNDGVEDSAPAAVNITVNKGNTPPTAKKQTITMLKNTAYNGTLSGSDTDGDRLIFKKNSEPSHGRLEIKDKNIGSFTYIPDTDYVGKDSFSFVVNDGTEDSTSAKVNIKVINIHVPKDRDKDEKIPSHIQNEINIDKNNSKNQRVIGAVDYKNESNEMFEDVVISIPIPDEMEAVDVTDGKIINGEIIWEVGDLKPNEFGSVHFVMKYNGDDDYKIVKLLSFIESKKNGEKFKTNGFITPILVFSKNFTYSTQGYIKGYLDKTVKPDCHLSRIEAISIFARLIGDNFKPRNNISYRDILADDWYYNNVAIVSEKGLIDIYDGNELKPNCAVTKVELALIISKYLGISTEDITNEDQYFIDIKGHFAQPYINQLCKLNILSNIDREFNPNKKITRAEAIVIINKMLNRKPITNCESSFIDLSKNHWAFEDIEAASRNLK